MRRNEGAPFPVSNSVARVWAAVVDMPVRHRRESQKRMPELVCNRLGDLQRLRRLGIDQTMIGELKVQRSLLEGWRNRSECRTSRASAIPIVLRRRRRMFDDGYHFVQPILVSALRLSCGLTRS